jgi:hypothetical protein
VVTRSLLQRTESTGRGVTTGVRAVTRAATAITGARETSTGQGFRVRGCAFPLRYSHVGSSRSMVYRPSPRRALAAAIPMCGAQPDNGVRTSCKPLGVLRCGTPAGYRGTRGNTITVTKRESTGRACYTRSHSSYTGCYGCYGRNSIGNSAVTSCNTDDCSLIHDGRFARQWMCWVLRCRTMENSPGS